MTVPATTAEGLRQTPFTVGSTIPQALLGYPSLINRIDHDKAFPMQSSPPLPGAEAQLSEATLLQPRRTPLELVANAIVLEERMGMSPDQVNDSLLPVIDAFRGEVNWDYLRQSLQTLSGSLRQGPFRDVWMERLEPFTDLAIGLAERLELPEVAECESMVRDAIYQCGSVDSVQAARAAVKWNDADPFGRFPQTERPERVPPLIRDLLHLIGPADFNRLGEMIAKGETEGQDLGHIPDDVGRGMVDCFEMTGYVVRSPGGGVRLTARGKDEVSLGYDTIRGSVMAFDFLSAVKPREPIGSFEDIRQAYKTSAADKAVETVHVEVDKPARKILYLSEILLGDSTTDVGFVDRVITKVETMTPETRPDIIVASGLLDGGFKYRDKEQRQNLVMDIGQQFAGARLILNRLAATGARVIYNMSDRDREVARDTTIDAMRLMQRLSGPITDQATYYQQDQLQQNPIWDLHRAFATNVAFQYCLRSGHPLRSADEMARDTGGRVRLNEYLLLFDAYTRRRNGEPIPPEYEQALRMENIPFPGREFADYRFADDFDLVTTIRDSAGAPQDITDHVRHNLKFGNKSMYQKPTDAMDAAVGHLNSETVEGAPHSLVMQHQQAGIAMGTAEGSWTLSTPGFSDPSVSLEQRGSVAGAGQNASWRLLTTRRSLPFPSAIMQEMTADERYILHILNKKLLDKTNISPERITAAFLMDWQQGSVTARPDLQMKLLDIILQKLPEEPVHLFFAGDIVQGRNYKGMPNENALVGLIRIDDQKEFVRRMLDLSLRDISPGTLRNLKRVGIVPGNHEWNSGYEMLGITHSSFLQSTFRDLLKDTSAPVTYYDAVSTGYGDFFKSWTAVDKDVAGYGLMVQHMMLEKGAGKGGSDTPIYQAAEIFRGEGDLVRDVDAAVFGHWHHPQFGLFGNKIAVVTPSVAGLSGYEWMRAYRPVMGGVLLHLGGGLPPAVEFLSAKSLYAHTIENGYFSMQHLNQLGFRDDQDFDPARHGFVNPRTPKSALQKALQVLKSDVIGASQTEL